MTTVTSLEDHLKLTWWQRAFCQSAQFAIQETVGRVFLEGVEGIGRLEHFEGGIIVANHQSSIDHLIIGAMVKLVHDRKVYFLSKQRLHERWVASRLWHQSMGSIPIGGEKLRPSGYRACRQVLRAGQILCIYPEGVINQFGRMGEFLPGAFRLAAMAKVPILLASIRGADSLLPRGRYIPTRSRVSVSFMETISPESLVSTGGQQLVARCRSVIEESVARPYAVDRTDMVEICRLAQELSSLLPWCQRVGEYAALRRRVATLAIIAKRMRESS